MKKRVFLILLMLSYFGLQAQDGLLLQSQEGWNEYTTNIEVVEDKIYCLSAKWKHLILRELNTDLELVNSREFEISTTSILMGKSRAFKAYEDYLLWTGAGGRVVSFSYDLDTNWFKTYSIIDGEYLVFDVNIQKDNNHYLFGRSEKVEGLEVPLFKFSMLKINPQGDSLYARNNDFHDKNDALMQAAVIDSNKILLCGSRLYPWDAQVLLVDTLGNILWEQVWGGEYYDSYSYMTVLDSTAILSYFKSFDTYQPTASSPGAYTYDSLTLLSFHIETGEVLWEQQHHSVTDGFITNCIPLSDGNFITTGFHSYCNSDTTFCQERSLALKFDAQGNELWRQDYAFGLGIQNYIFDVEELSSGDLILSGFYVDLSGEDPLQLTWLLKTDANGEPIALFLPEESQAFTVYPNPCSDVLYIDSELQNPIEELRLYDLQGKLVQQQKGYSGSLDIQAQPRGIYLLQIRTEKGLFTKKVLKE